MKTSIFGRAAIPTGARARAAQTLGEIGLTWLPDAAGATISGFFSIGDELATQPLLAADGTCTALCRQHGHIAGHRCLRARFAGLIHAAAHFQDGILQPDEDRLADQEMADVQLHHLRDGSYGGDVFIGQAVAHMNLQPQ